VGFEAILGIDMRLNVVQPEKEEDVWYADGLHFTCSQCGNCCTGGPGFVWVSEVEIGRLAEYLKVSREEVVEKYCRAVGEKYSLKETLRQGLYDCVFLKEVKGESREGGEKVVQSKRVCSIYPVRPLQCRTWPFWDGVLAGKAIWEEAGKRCHGMDRGKFYSKERIEALRDAKDWPGDAPGSK
jgi:Fe-S-cluster containining protein